jgi:sec-independent protein translocase protein TatA
MVPLALFGPIGAWEIVLILLIVVFLFGARRIPEIARGLGEGIRGFRTSLRGDAPEAESAGSNENADERED